MFILFFSKERHHRKYIFEQYEATKVKYFAKTCARQSHVYVMSFSERKHYLKKKTNTMNHQKVYSDGKTIFQFIEEMELLE